MLYSQYLPRIITIVFFVLLFSCGTDKDNVLGLAENELAYILANGTSRTYSASCTLTNENDEYKLTFRASEASDGIIITLKNVKPFESTNYTFFKDVSIIINDKTDGELYVYVTTGCKDIQGAFEILNWDKKNKTITGKFSGPICTRGIFAHIPSTHIDEAAFYKIKYNER